MLSTVHAYVIAFVGGCILWTGTSIVTGRAEAWNASLYWVAAYPLTLALAEVLGYLVPARPWRWALAVMLGQAVMLAITASDFGLFPLGLIMFAILALPSIIIAFMTAGIRNRRGGR